MKSSRLPPLVPGCVADSLDVAAPIRLADLTDGTTLRRAPHSDHALRVTLNALGIKGSVEWLLNGRVQGSSERSAPIRIKLPQGSDYRIRRSPVTARLSRCACTR